MKRRTEERIGGEKGRIRDRIDGKKKREGSMERRRRSKRKGKDRIDKKERG